jgi:hypothetical protein
MVFWSLFLLVVMHTHWKRLFSITADDMVLDGEKAKDKKDLKGKGKAVERGKGRARDQSIEVDIGDRMNDITNSKLLSFLLIFPLVSYMLVGPF